MVRADRGRDPAPVAVPPAATAAGVIHACVSAANGNVRIVSPPAGCKKAETPLTWNEAPGFVGNPPAGTTLEFSFGVPQAVTITNVGGAPAGVVAVEASAFFSIVSHDCGGLYLSPGQSCWVTLGTNAFFELGGVLTITTEANTVSWPLHCSQDNCSS